MSCHGSSSGAALWSPLGWADTGLMGKRQKPAGSAPHLHLSPLPAPPPFAPPPPFLSPFIAIKLSDQTFLFWFRHHQAVFKAYSELCAQGLLLSGLRVSVLGIEPDTIAHQAKPLLLSLRPPKLFFFSFWAIPVVLRCYS